MDSVTKVSAETVPASTHVLLMHATAVVCGLGLVIFACIATEGLDISYGFF